MDFRRLSYFVAVVDHGGFTAAAKALHVSQPAVSAAVRELEAEVGGTLLERHGRSCRPTAAGVALLGPARAALRDLTTAEAAVSAVLGLRGGTLTIAALPSLALSPTPQLVGEFRRRFPAVAVEVRSPEDTEDLVRQVRDGRVELAISTVGDLPEDLCSHPVGDQELVFLCPPGTAQPAEAPWSAFAELAQVVTPKGTSLRANLDQAFADAELEVTVAVTAAQREAILPLVLAGAGAALVPSPVAELGVRLGAVAVRPRPAVIRQIVVAHRPSILSPAAEGFLEGRPATEARGHEPR